MPTLAISRRLDDTLLLRSLPIFAGNSFASGAMKRISQPTPQKLSVFRKVARCRREIRFTGWVLQHGAKRILVNRDMRRVYGEKIRCAMISGPCNELVPEFE